MDIPATVPNFMGNNIDARNVAETWTPHSMTDRGAMLIGMYKP